MHSSLATMTNKLSHCDECMNTLYEYMKINHDIFLIISTNEAYATIICLQSAIFQSVHLIFKLKKKSDIRTDKIVKYKYD